jgi:hypothetical protein
VLSVAQAGEGYIRRMHVLRPRWYQQCLHKQPGLVCHTWLLLCVLLLLLLLLVGV